MKNQFPSCYKQNNFLSPACTPHSLGRKPMINCFLRVTHLPHSWWVHLIEDMCLQTATRWTPGKQAEIARFAREAEFHASCTHDREPWRALTEEYATNAKDEWEKKCVLGFRCWGSFNASDSSASYWIRQEFIIDRKILRCERFRSQWLWCDSAHREPIMKILAEKFSFFFALALVTVLTIGQK